MKLKQIISWIAVLLWMGLIFSLSAQPAADSNQLSKGVTKVVIEVVEKVAPKAELEVRDYNHFIRKNAHFLAYLVLGVLVMQALSFGKGRSARRNAFIAVIICLFYAMSDEVHQLYVPGRGAQLGDVGIDGVGGMVGVGVYQVVRLGLKGGFGGRKG
jgi:VanZ family protein